jgi:hypothetical protein
MAAVARRQQQQQMRDMAAAPGPGLQEVLKPEVLTPLLQDPEVCYILVTFILLNRHAACHAHDDQGDECGAMA